MIALVYSNSVARSAYFSLAVWLLLSAMRSVHGQQVLPSLLLNGASAAQTPGQGVNAARPDDEKVAGRPGVRSHNVTAPTVTWYPASERGDAISPAVPVLPGGGYQIVAADLEGSEICSWLNGLGISALLLRYRVPTPEPHDGPLSDAQSALSLMHNHARQWRIDESHVGVIGFSAGAHLALKLASQLGSIPIHTLVLIYPAYLQGEATRPTAAGKLAMPLGAHMPPTFLVQTQDDPVGVGNALEAMIQLHVPVEFHIYPTGGHGYGLRRTDTSVTHWPDLAAVWLAGNGFLVKGIQP